MRRLLCQAAQAAVKKKGSYLQSLFRRLVVRLGYPKAVRRTIQRHLKALRRLGYQVPHEPASATAAPGV
jgi:hypothetical protein